MWFGYEGAHPYIDLGRIHMSRNRYKDALSAYEKATVVDPNSAHALDSLGWAYFRTGDHQRAAVVLQDVFLFSGTVGGNIRLGSREIDDERVRWAAREVEAGQELEVELEWNESGRDE